MSVSHCSSARPVLSGLKLELLTSLVYTGDGLMKITPVTAVSYKYGNVVGLLCVNFEYALHKNV